MDYIRRDYVKSCYHSASAPIIKYTASVEEINILNSCKKVMETVDLTMQACADEVEIKLASLLAICYSLLFVAFSLIQIFHLTWVFEHICI